MSLFVGYLALAWTGPTATAPGENIAAPLNTSITAQSKEGALVLGTNAAITTALIVQNGNVGIGVTSPGAKLEVAGQVKITGGSPGANKVLTSDATGLATWEVSIPSGMIAMFDTACPSGWTRFSALDGKFPYGASSYGATGGASSHSHSVDPPNTTSGAGPADSYAYVEALGAQMLYGIGSGSHTSMHYHTHTVDVASFSSESVSSLPPYLSVVWCKKN